MNLSIFIQQWHWQTEHRIIPPHRQCFSEILTPEKLHKRNIAFNELARHCEVELYDGWAVEKLI
jgi:hypothetical protein